MEPLTVICQQMCIRDRCKAVYEKYQKIFFKKTKEKFKLEHPEVARFEKALSLIHIYNIHNRAEEIVLHEMIYS